MIFGGILGDNPPQGRTKKLHDLCTMRSLGREQMSTDTAVMVTHMVLNGKKLSDIDFQDTIEFETNKGESIILPYRYVLENGKPVLLSGRAPRTVAEIEAMMAEPSALSNFVLPDLDKK